MKAGYYLATLDTYTCSDWLDSHVRHPPHEHEQSTGSIQLEVSVSQHVTAKALQFSSHIHTVCVHCSRKW